MSTKINKDDIETIQDLLGFTFEESLYFRFICNHGRGRVYRRFLKEFKLNEIEDSIKYAYFKLSENEILNNRIKRILFLKFNINNIKDNGNYYSFNTGIKEIADIMNCSCSKINSNLKIYSEKFTHQMFLYLRDLKEKEKPFIERDLSCTNLDKNISRKFPFYKHTVKDISEMNYRELRYLLKESEIRELKEFLNRNSLEIRKMENGGYDEKIIIPDDIQLIMNETGMNFNYSRLFNEIRKILKEYPSTKTLLDHDKVYKILKYTIDHVTLEYSVQIIIPLFQEYFNNFKDDEYYTRFNFAELGRKYNIRYPQADFERFMVYLTKEFLANCIIYNFNKRCGKHSKNTFNKNMLLAVLGNNISNRLYKKLSLLTIEDLENKEDILFYRSSYTELNQVCNVLKQIGYKGEILERLK